MKRDLLTLGMLVLGLAANAQVLTYVGSDALVTVQPQTLVYSGGGWQNAAKGSGTAGAIVDNSGNIMVVGGASDLFKIDSQSSADATGRFKLNSTDKSTYAQLYISGIPQANISGKVTKEYFADYKNGSSYSSTNAGQQQMGFPFVNYTVADLTSQIGSFLNTTDTRLVKAAGRFALNSVFRWNTAIQAFDQISGAGNIGTLPTDYYAVPVVDATGAQQWNPVTTKTTLLGTPSSDDASQVTVAFTGGAVNFGTGGSGVNKYRERYNSYVVDPFRAGWSAADYGLNTYQYANPFLTNLDLSILGSSNAALPNLEGVALYQNGSNDYKINTGSAINNAPLVINTSGGVFQSGDLNKLMIKPLGTFMVKLSSAGSSSLNLGSLPFRTFKASSRTTINSDPTAQATKGEAKMASTESLASQASISSIPSAYVVRQVAAVLYDTSGNEIGRTYYAVSPSFATGFHLDNLQQAYITDANAPIYTSEEAATGGADATRNDKVYINAANELDYKGKAIPVSVAATNAAAIGFEVYEGGKRLSSGASLSTGESFYLGSGSSLTQINDGTKINLAGKDFNLYYGQPQGIVSTAAIAQSETIIGKLDSDYAVRFAKTWNSATVEIFSAAGQLLFTKANISTDNDFILPINSYPNGLFVVKATSDKGEVVVKKILK